MAETMVISGSSQICGRWRLLSISVLLRSLIILALVVGPVSGCLEARPAAPAATASPLPLDPLSPEEEARAIDLALADHRVTALLTGERYRAIGAALHADKASILAGANPRLADVHVYRYGSNDVVWPVVDLKAGAVASVAVEAFQPRLTEDEVLEAEAALLADPRVAARVGSLDGVHVNVILKSSDVPGTSCSRDRCVEAMFMRGDAMVEGALATFDLSARFVVDVWSPEVPR